MDKKSNVELHYGCLFLTVGHRIKSSGGGDCDFEEEKDTPYDYEPEDFDCDDDNADDNTDNNACSAEDTGGGEGGGRGGPQRDHEV